LDNRLTQYNNIIISNSLLVYTRAKEALRKDNNNNSFDLLFNQFIVN